ncbi:Coatomer subunit gamma-1, partial [Trichinella nativa]
LATKVLNLLGKEGPKCSNPRKYIRFIFNRVLLEPPPVRAGNTNNNQYEKKNIMMRYFFSPLL